jgi:hypothetical protein
MSVQIRISAAMLMFAVAACGRGEANNPGRNPASSNPTTAHGGGGGSQVPPPPTVDRRAFLVHQQRRRGHRHSADAECGLRRAAEHRPGRHPHRNQPHGSRARLFSAERTRARSRGCQPTAATADCFDGIAIGPHGICYLGIGLAPDAVAPSNALLVIQSNDPVQPETDMVLTLTAP